MDSRVAVESRPLVSWPDVSAALDEVIAHCEKTLDVFDHAMTLQGWESSARCNALAAAMHERRVHVRVLLVDDGKVTAAMPRLINLLKTHGHRLTLMVTENPPQSTASYVVADRQHILFRPNSVHSRGSLHWSDPYKSTTYTNLFEVSWQQGGRRIFPEAFGL